MAWRRDLVLASGIRPPYLGLLFRFRQRSHSETSEVGNWPLYPTRGTLFWTIFANATIHHVIRAVLHTATTTTLPLFFFPPT